MIKIFQKISMGSIVVAVSLAMGCAKKNKPDYLNEYYGANVVQDKDMSFDPTGSDSGKIEGLSTVHFDYDKSNLSNDTREILVKDANWLKQHHSSSLVIEGHCDRHGSTEYNLGLGQKRANAVRDYLVNLGIEKDRLSGTSFGKEQMIDTSETDEADAKNRRVNFRPVDGVKLNHMSSM